MPGELIEIPPDSCSQGHRFGPNLVLAGWHTCGCSGVPKGKGGHRSYRCRVCDELLVRGRHDPTAGEELVTQDGSWTYVRDRPT